MNITDPRSARNLVTESNPLTDSDAYYEREWAHMTLRELVANGGRVTRVRFLTESVMGRRMADLSYVHGEVNGKPVRLDNAPAIFLTPMHKLAGELIEWAKSEGVYAKGCGLLDKGNWSTLY